MAPQIFRLSGFGIGFVKGDENYDPNGINAMKGAFWYGSVAFMKKLLELVNCSNH